METLTAVEVRLVTVDEAQHMLDAEHKAHAEEIASRIFTMPYNPNFDTYRTLEAAGNFLPLAAFIDEECVGYLNIMASPSLCSQDYVVAVADGFYVNPKFRRRGVMQALVAEAESMCKEANIHSLSLAVMEGKGGGASFVESLGYTRAEITYTKLL